MPRRGRRPGDEDTRQAILTAAREAFASMGYDRATVRRIAGDAGVDPALVYHYFGKKEDLFAAAIDVPFRPADVVGGILGTGTEGAGERITRFFFTVWENPDSRHALVGQLRHALSSGERPAIAEFVSEVLLQRVAAGLEGPDPDLRAEMVGAHLLGLAILRYVVQLEPLASAPIERVVEMVAPRIQSYFDPPAPSTGGGR